MSTENPPNDPSCSCNLLHLTSPGDELLGQSSLDHHNHNHNHNLPSFSIRDYARSFRNKDIKKNWPFSPKSLQLCLKNGLNDLLPPFQPLHAVEDHCAKTCSAEAHSSLENQISPNVEVKIPVCLSDKNTLDNLGSNQTLLETRKAVDSSGFRQSEAENELLPTTSSVSQSDIELVTINKSLSKKCGIILKSGGCVNRGLREDSCLATSESMASKTCPVCKTFSSASNTTLNAHIDQCLSADSATSNSKPGRHRIKPRKIRPMTDIYATAESCTIEKIDKINGNSGCIADESEVSNKRKKGKALQVHPDGYGGRVGPVYIDASGRKLRILSQINYNTSSVSKEHKDKRVKQKSPREGKGRKCFPTKKKGHWRKNNHKLLRLTPQSRKFSCQISEHQEGYTGEGSEKEKLQIPKQLKPSQPRASNCWLLAKRTGLSRKASRKGHKYHVSTDQLFEKEHSWLGDSMVVRNPTHKSTDFSGSAVSSPLNKQKIWEPCGATKVTGKNGTLFGSKRAKGPTSRVQIIENKETSLVTVQQNTSKSKKNILSFHEDFSAGKTFSTDEVKCRDVSSCATSGRNMSSTFGAKFTTSEDMLGEEDENGEMWKWESDMENNDSDEALMDQEPAFTDSEMDEYLMDPDSSFCGDDDYDDHDESYEGDAKIDNDGFDQINGAETVFYQSDTPLSTEICNGSIFPGGRSMNYTGEVAKVIYAQTAQAGTDDPDSEIRRGSSFMEVDPIPIPGPPGSFLPSPRGIGSDDFPGNSSVTTSQVQSSKDQLDLVDRNSSESPVSTACRSRHVNYPTELSSIQEKVPASYSASTMNSGASSQETNAGAEWTSGRGKFDLHCVSIDKRPFGLRNNCQPCCCQRKEKSSEGIINANNQESQLLMRRTASSLMLPERRRPIGFDPNTAPSSLDTDLDSFEPHIFRNPVLLPNSNHRPSASPSNSVLRLMGKDLMIVNQGEEASRPVSHRESSLHSTPQFLDPSRTSKSTFYHSVPQLSSPLLQSPCAETSLCFNTSNCFGNNANSTAPKTPAWASTGALEDNFGLLPYFAPANCSR